MAEKFRIDTVVNAEGVAPGVEQTVDGLRAIGTESDVAAGKGNRLMEELGERRGSQRAAMELFEVLRGGGATIEGLTGLLRGFLLTAEGLDPAVLIIGAVGLALTGLVARHEDTAHKTDETARSTDHLKDAYEQIKPAIEAYKTLLEQVGAEEKTIESIQKNNLQDIKDESAEKRKSLDLDKEIAIERARQQYLTKAASTDDPDERKRLKARFEATQKDIEGATGVNTARLDLQEKQDEIDATKLALAQQQQEIESLRNQIVAMQDKRTRDAEFLAPLGLKFDDKGLLVAAQSTVDPTTGKLREADQPGIEELKKQLDLALQNRIDAPDYLRDNAVRLSTPGRRQEYLDEVTKAVQLAQSNLDRAQQIQADRPANSEVSETTLQSQVKDLAAKLDETQRALEKLQLDVELAKKGVELAGLKDQNDEAEGALSESDTEKGIAASDKKKADEVARQRQSAARRAESEQERVNRNQIEGLEGSIESTGNKPLIEAMRRVVEMFKGKQGESSQLAEIAALTNLFIDQTHQFQQQTTTAIGDLRRKIDNHGNHG